MPSEMPTLLNPTSMPHPGDTVLEYLEFHGWSQSDLARRTALTAKTISEICNGKTPITPPTALALEKVFGRPAHFWLNIQRQFDEAAARHRERQQYAKWSDWAQRFPLKEMKRLKWIPAYSTLKADVEALLGFLGVSSPQSWQSMWKASDVAYRQTRKFTTSAEAISVWVRATELAASELRVGFGSYSERQLRSSIKELRACTAKRIDEVIARVQSLCAAAGVAVVWVPALPQTGISGCARWLTDNRALIALTLRYKTDDQMWFTFFHELGHILLHRRKRAFVLDNADSQVTDRVVDPEMQQYEDEANRFAADILIPPPELAAFIKSGTFTSEAIFQFAKSMGIGPGLVVGRLQHDAVLAPFQGNAFKQRLSLKMLQDRE